MRPLLRRIALNGLLTAAILAVMGFAYAELAAIWLASTPVPRTETVPTATAANEVEALRDSLRIRVPLTMAACGVAFIAVAELVLYWWRGNPPVIVKKSVVEARIDPAEKLLEELLAQADSAMAAANEPAQPSNTSA